MYSWNMKKSLIDCLASHSFVSLYFTDGTNAVAHFLPLHDSGQFTNETFASKDCDCQWISKIAHYNTASRQHICFYHKKTMAPISTTFRECGPARAKIAPCENSRKWKRKIIAKDTNCNVGGMQPCCSMFQKALFDGFARECLVLLIEE